MSARIATILDFWLRRTPEEDWYKEKPALDRTIRRRFSADWGRAVADQLGHWGDSREGALAFIILTDQFPRNMFRGRGLAFASDDRALAAAKKAVDRGYDLETPPPARQFFYLPLMHSENAADQDRCCALFAERMADTDHLLHARAHREVILAHGRFPTRNAALGRPSSAGEEAYLADGGYGAIVRRMKEGLAPDA